MALPAPIYKVKLIAPLTITNDVGGSLVLNTGDMATIQRVVGVEPQVSSGGLSGVSHTSTLIRIKSGNQQIHVWMKGTSIPDSIKKQGEFKFMGIIDSKIPVYSSADGNPENYELGKDIKAIKFMCSAILGMMLGNMIWKFVKPN